MTKYKNIFIALLVLAISGLAIFGMFQTVVAQKTYDVVFDGYGTIFTAINTFIVFSFILVFYIKKICPAIFASLSQITHWAYIFCMV